MPRRPVNETDEVAAALQRMVGIWEGSGSGGFPTIDEFTYREVLHITAHEEDPVLHYEQQTWRATGEGEVASHWESGFVRAAEEGRVDLLNAQESGRVEVLVGHLFQVDEHPLRWELVLESAVHGHDPRMRSSSRTIQFGSDQLTYEMWMSTDLVSDARKHLAARLDRRHE